MKIVCLCHTCARRHVMDFDPCVGPGAGFSDWLMKHPAGHDTDFFWPERSGKVALPDSRWLDYLGNADVKTAYAAEAQVTITLASLASSSSLLTGQQSTAIDNTTNLYLDYFVSGFFKVGTSPTASTSINVIATSRLYSTNWPDAFTGTDGTITVTSQGVYNAIAAYVASIGVDTTTTGQTYPFSRRLLGQMFGGTVTGQFAFGVFQNTGVAFDSTAGNHRLEVQGVYCTIA